MTVQEYEEKYGVKLVPYTNDQIRCGEQAFGALHKKYGDAEQESVFMIALNNAKEILAIEEIHKGTIDRSMMYARDVYRTAIRLNAASIIVAHNHPGGSLNFSQGDQQAYERLNKAGEILGVELLDFLVVSRKGWNSIKM